MRKSATPPMQREIKDEENRNHSASARTPRSPITRDSSTSSSLVDTSTSRPPLSPPPSSTSPFYPHAVPLSHPLAVERPQLKCESRAMRNNHASDSLGGERNAARVHHAPPPFLAPRDRRETRGAQEEGLGDLIILLDEADLRFSRQLYRASRPGRLDRLRRATARLGGGDVRQRLDRFEDLAGWGSFARRG